MQKIQRQQICKFGKVTELRFCIRLRFYRLIMQCSSLILIHVSFSLQYMYTCTLSSLFFCNFWMFLYFVVLAVLLQHINLPEVTIAFDGSLYEKHPKYSLHIGNLLAKLVPTTKVRGKFIFDPVRKDYVRIFCMRR